MTNQEKRQKIAEAVISREGQNQYTQSSKRDRVAEGLSLIHIWLTYMKLIVEHLHPDVIVSHDDWGSKNSLFMSPEVWRDLFKEPYRRLYQYLHDNGVIVMPVSYTHLGGRLPRIAPHP